MSSGAFHTANPSLFFSRGDKNDPRLGDIAVRAEHHGQLSELKSLLNPLPQFAMAGYPDDEGIDLNGGRIGAREGPDRIRQYLYKTTPPRRMLPQMPPLLVDLGNLAVDQPLADRHEAARAWAAYAMKSQIRWIGLGGGHDYGYPDGAAFLEAASTQERPLILNFDAHMDVRPLDRGLSSGTPFFRLLETGIEFDFAEIGIQRLCNSVDHVEWAQRRNVRILYFDDLLAQGTRPLADQVRDALGDWLRPNRPCFLSLDIDGFSSSYAPGCSQSWPLGFTPHQFFPLLDLLLRTLHVQCLGLYEVSPRLDLDDRTSKLAAQIIHSYLFHPAHQPQS